MSQKGGSGKTTTVVHLAVAAGLSGLRTLIVDTDPQRSAVIWRQARDELGGAEPPAVVGVDAHDIEAALKRAKADGYDLAIIDTAPHLGVDAARIARAAHHVLLPVRPSLFDLAALPAGLDIVRAAGADCSAVLSSVPLRAPEARDARAVLESYSLAVAPDIGERRVYARATAAGSTALEFEPGGAAAAEVQQLANWLLARINRKERARV